jgi:hypothetical protein
MRVTGTIEEIAQLEKGRNKDLNGLMYGASFKQAIKTLKVKGETPFSKKCGHMMQ